jgi:hypothetical protein
VHLLVEPEILAINNGKLNFEITIDDNDLKNAGFEKVSIINKNIIINLADGQTILSRFKTENLEGTLKSLKNKLIDKDVDEQTL